ncbi:ureidoglycolate lyase [Rhodobacteraceae bacterium M385]|nr:ureidoglycolate lyase [Rhodobacteraceae bacterium M385]
MTGLVVTLQPPDPVAFAPFGQFVTAPDQPGKRQFYSEALHPRSPSSAPVLHVNHVLPKTFPIEVSGIERHPHAAQCFFPIDVARYAVMVMPSDQTGAPLLDQARGFMVPGTMGVIYNRGVWHLGATVLERTSHFAVLMWRGGAQQDDDFLTIDPMTLVEPL